ncbi:MFS transporter [candidate division KSB1 bacterium]
MKSLISFIWKIREQERTRAIHMFWLIFLLMTTYLILKPARSALFLVDVGPEQLPYLHILVALCVCMFFILFDYFTAKIPLHLIIDRSLIISIIVLLLFWWIFRYQNITIAYSFYIGVSIFGALITSHFWLIAQEIFDAREAKRTFGIISSGGILGGILGSFLTRLLLLWFDMRSLIFLCIALLIICLFLYKKIIRFQPHDHQDSNDPVTQNGILKEVPQAIIRSKYLRILSLLMLVGIATATIVDIQFNTITFEYYQDKRDLAKFFGGFFFILSSCALIFQGVFSGLLLKRTGLGNTLSIMPLAVFLGSILFIFFPVLFSATLIRIFSVSFRTRSAQELTFLPVPPNIKMRVKLFVDILLDRFARGIGGGLFLLFTVVLALNIRHISIIVILLCLLSLKILRNFQKEYLEMFRSSLSLETLDPDQLKLMIKGSEVVNTISKNLNSPYEKEVLYILSILESVDDKSILPELKVLLVHDSPEVRAKAVQMLFERDEGEYLDEIRKLFDDNDHSVVFNAVKYYCYKASGSLEKNILKILDTPKLNVISSIIQLTGTLEKWDSEYVKPENLIEELLLWSKSGSKEAKIEMIRALPYSKSSRNKKLIAEFFEEKDLNVLQQVILTAGKLRRREYISSLFQYLSQKDTNINAQIALTMYGNKVVGALSDGVFDTEYDYKTRLSMIKILQNIGTNHALDGLVFCLETEEIQIRLPILKALNELQSKKLSFAFMTNEINEIFRYEIQYYSILSVIWTRLDLKDAFDGSLLQEALEQDLSTSFERLFRTLSLLYYYEDIMNAYNSIISGKRYEKAKAIEFLENGLDKEHAGEIINILENPDYSKLAFSREGWAQKHISGEFSAIKTLLELNNEILQFYTLFYIHEHNLKNLEPEIKDLLFSNNPLLVESAESVSTQLKMRNDIMPSNFEKVLFLNRLELFSSSTPASIYHLVAIANEIEYSKGKTIVSLNDSANGIFIILQGEVELIRNDETVAVLKEGEIIGSWALFEEESWLYTAVAKSKTALLNIERDRFYDLLDIHPEISKGLFKSLSHKIRMLKEQMNHPSSA